MNSPVKKLFLFLMFIASTSLAKAQDGAWDIKGKASKAKGSINKEKNKVKKFKDYLQRWGLDSNYRHGVLIGGKLNTNGWTGTAYYQHKRTSVQSAIWQLSFSEIKHDKQVKQENTKSRYTQFGNPTPYIFGKINNLYTLQIGYGLEYLLLPNVVEDNLTVIFRWTAGFSLAMLKPYYVRLVHNETSPDTTFMLEERYSADNSELYLNNNNILGPGKWSKGLGDMEYIPGAFADIAFVIEPAKNKNFVQVITLGINGAFYANQLPIMAKQPTSNWKAALYVGLMLGKRWK
jgi:hypothetical protein